MQSIGLSGITDRMDDSVSGAMALAEYGYYFVIFYTILAPPLGLVLPGSIGSGFLLIPVLAVCLIALGSSALTVMKTIWIPLACGASYLFIQLALHEEFLSRMYVYQFGPWLISLVIVQALAMHRYDFMHRFAWFTIFMGLAILPFFSLQNSGG